MHYAEFAEDEVRLIMTHLHHMFFLTLPANQSVALREAIKEYEANKWKVIGQKVGKPAKVSFLLSPFSIFYLFFSLFILPISSCRTLLNRILTWQACEQYAKEHFKNV